MRVAHRAVSRSHRQALSSINPPRPQGSSSRQVISSRLSPANTTRVHCWSLSKLRRTSITQPTSGLFKSTVPTASRRGTCQAEEEASQARFTAACHQPHPQLRLLTGKAPMMATGTKHCLKVRASHLDRTLTPLPAIDCHLPRRQASPTSRVEVSRVLARNTCPRMAQTKTTIAYGQIASQRTSRAAHWLSMPTTLSSRPARFSCHLT